MHLDEVNIEVEQKGLELSQLNGLIQGLESNLLEITSLNVTEEDADDLHTDETFMKLRDDMNDRLQAEYDALFNDIRGNIFKVCIEKSTICVYLHLNSSSSRKEGRPSSKS